MEVTVTVETMESHGGGLGDQWQQLQWRVMVEAQRIMIDAHYGGSQWRLAMRACNEGFQWKLAMEAHDRGSCSDQTSGVVREWLVAWWKCSGGGFA